MSISQSSKNRKNAMPMIAVMGVDGSGKSSLVERLESKLTPHGVKGIHVLARIDNTAQPGDVILNHNKPPRPLFVSVAKFAVKLVEWGWQYYRLSSLRSKGFVIILDRFYFFDILIDPLKYRYSGPLWLVDAMSRIVPKPNLYLLLDLPEHVALSRKQEVSADEVSRQRHALINLFRALPNSHILNAANDIDKVVEDAVEIILQYIPK
jgi:thymidylate kinase